MPECLSGFIIIRKMKTKKYSILKVPNNLHYITWKGYTIQNFEDMLNLIAQGYEDEVKEYIVKSYANQSWGDYKLLLDLLNNEDEVEAGY